MDGKRKTSEDIKERETWLVEGDMNGILANEEFKKLCEQASLNLQNAILLSDTPSDVLNATLSMILNMVVNMPDPIWEVLMLSVKIGAKETRHSEECVKTHVGVMDALNDFRAFGLKNRKFLERNDADWQSAESKVTHVPKGAQPS